MGKVMRMTVGEGGKTWACQPRFRKQKSATTRQWGRLAARVCFRVANRKTLSVESASRRPLADVFEPGTRNVPKWCRALLSKPGFS